MLVKLSGGARVIPIAKRQHRLILPFNGKRIEFFESLDSLDWIPKGRMLERIDGVEGIAFLFFSEGTEVSERSLLFRLVVVGPLLLWCGH